RWNANAAFERSVSSSESLRSVKSCKWRCHMIPGFTAEASIYQTSRCYTEATQPGQSAETAEASVIPQLIRNCRSVCGGDPDCMECCLCIRGGGHPRQCCF